MPLYTKVSGTWRNAQKPYVKISNTWRQVATVYTKVNGVWRNLHTFTWATGAYGSCSASCGGGTMYRTVTCTRSDNLTFVDSVCTTLVGSKPSTSASCNTHGCETYSWYADNFVNYNETCMCVNMNITRTVYCRRSDGVQVADGYCTGTKPISSMTCVAWSASVGVSPPKDCTWYTGGWTTICQHPEGKGGCGNGLVYRDVICRTNKWTVNGSPAEIADSYCLTYTGSKPSTSQTCKDCGWCHLYWNETAVLAAKQKREGMTPAAIKQAILNAGFASVRSWWDMYGALGVANSEKICPVKNSSYDGCCQTAGYSYWQD